MYVTIRGQKKILDYFSGQKQPMWRLFPADDPRSVISQNLDISDQSKSHSHLLGVINYLDPDNVYTLELFKAASDKKYGKPDNSVNFSLSETAAVSEIKKPGADRNNIADFIKGDMDLIRENATLRSNLGIKTFELEQAQKTILQLQNEIVELEEELDEMVEEAEEHSITGNAQNDPIKQKIADLMEKGGGLLIEHLGKKSSKKKLDDEDIEITVNGITNDKYLAHPIETYIEQLKKVDPNLHYHLYKLVLVSQKMPDTFKLFLTELENM